MEQIESFEKFLKKKNQAKTHGKPDWENRKKKWLQSIENIYSNIESWLKPFIDKELLEIKKAGKIEITEDYIGRYQASVLEINIGDDIIRLKPRGTLVLGSYGRIDMAGPKGEVILIEPEWNEWQIVEKIGDKRNTIDLNEESIKFLIQQVS